MASLPLAMTKCSIRSQIRYPQSEITRDESPYTTDEMRYTICNMLSHRSLDTVENFVPLFGYDEIRYNPRPGIG